MSDYPVYRASIDSLTDGEQRRPRLTIAGAQRVAIETSTGTPINAFGGGSGGQVEGTQSNASVTAPNPILTGGWDGSALRRITTDTTGNQVIVGNVASLSADSGAPLKMGIVYSNALPAPTAGQRVDVQADQSGNVRARFAVGTNTGADGLANTVGFGVGFNAAATNIPLGVFPYSFNGATWDRQRKPNGYSRIASTAATGSPTSAKASAGDLGTFWGTNAAAVTYLQLYNKASAPVLGTDTPVLTFPIPASATFAAPAGLAGSYFSTGIAYAFTTDAAGATAAAAGAITAFALTYA